MKDPLLRVPALRQYQVSARPGALRVRVVLRNGSDAVTVRQIRAIMEAELDRIDAATLSLEIEPVERIERNGPAAKDLLLSHEPPMGWPAQRRPSRIH